MKSKFENAWAEDDGIDDFDTCGGKSWSFEEVCRAYAKELIGRYGYDQDYYDMDD